MHFIEINYMSCIPWPRPVFTCIRQNIKRSLSHALLYSIIVFKYVILSYGKINTFWGELAYIFGDFLGRQGNYLQGDWEMNALFSGIKGAQTPLGASLQCIPFFLTTPSLFNCFFPALSNRLCNKMQG